jgi:aspartate racemase
MQTIGLLGGMSWESTASYYRLLNEGVRQRLGGLHSAKLLLCSVDFHEIEALQRAAAWDEAGARLAAAAQALERAGAGCILIGANTMHKVAPAVEAAVGIPLRHVADATAAAVRAAGLTTVGLLGTRFVMEQDFYVGRLRQRHGLGVLIPDLPQRELIHRVIFEELVLGKRIEASRAALAAIMAGLVARGAAGIILGCTEFSLLVGDADASVPLFDTTRLHAGQALDWALGQVP